MRKNHTADLAIACLMAVIGGLMAYLWARQLPPGLYDFWDFWFQADLPLQYERAAERMTVAHETKLHPLFSLVVWPIAQLLRSGLGIGVVESMRGLVSLVAGAWCGLLYSTLRLMACRQLDALLLTGLAMTSATARFWWPVLETCQFAALGTLFTLLIAILAERRPVAGVWYVVANVLTVSFTITNWLTGLVATIVQQRRQSALVIIIAAIGVVVGLYGVRTVVLPAVPVAHLARPGTTPNPQFAATAPEAAPTTGKLGKTRLQFLALPTADRVRYVMQSAIGHTLVMPAISTLPQTNPPQVIMTIQSALPGSGSWLGGIAIGLWTAILGLGLWNFGRTNRYPRFRIVLGVTLGAFLALHILFGEETFLYAPAFLTGLIPLAAFSTIGRTRWVGVSLIFCLLVTAGWHNFWQFEKTVSRLQQATLIGQDRH
jgi:hypothetical protein